MARTLGGGADEPGTAEDAAPLRHNEEVTAGAALVDAPATAVALQG
jgi:hypothetical protein